MASFFIACGGGSGGSDISGSKKLNELSTDEAMDLCEELTFSRMVTCEGETLTISSKDCSDISPPPSSCTATVAEARACTAQQKSASDADLCAGNLPACAALVACGGGGAP